ncbi:MAG: hypothetical protein KF684_08130 [Phycisphaeraceae bacterium]|nr:hypothetical protein [Phycisphaeraceae bacterium]
MDLSSDELRNYATVVAALVALLVFMVNSYLLVRNRRIENVARFIEAHDRLFDRDGYIVRNISAFDAGELKRDHANPQMEGLFHVMLIEIEHLAILANNSAVSRHTQVYMFGWYAQQILSVITEKERQAMAWELALDYLDRLSTDTAAYQALTPQQRRRFWR